MICENTNEAARISKLAENIKDIPINIYTIINNNNKTLSGSQHQRILITKTIINRPKILIFDEATSALDNQTQTIVSKSLSKLSATKIVIAHKLSTIIDTDRIYVINKEKLAESGTYKELMEKKKIFAELASKQII